MTSQRKIEANRLNALCSTGPKSSRGRSWAKRNALKLGIYAKTVLLPSENATAYAALRIEMFLTYEPRGPVEEGLVELVIAGLWRLDRLLRIENEFVRHTQAIRAVRESSFRSQKSIGTFLDELRGKPNGPTGPTALPAIPNAQRASPSHSDLDTTKTANAEAACLLDAYISPVSQSPMEDIARQRRQTNREILRNIAAIDALQNQRTLPRAPYPLISRTD
jgi:hypothetical protein